jgi:two-component system, LytTR family, response regulator AgrA
LLNIIICEDNKEQRMKIEAYIKASIDENQYDCKIVKSTNNPFEVIEYSKSHIDDANVYFFDVDLKDKINGIEAAAEIRKVDINCYFIFITGHSEYSMMTFEYKLKALDYIDKADFENLNNRINECLETVTREHRKIVDNNQRAGELLTIKSGTRVYNVPLKDVIYIETISSHKVKLHSLNSDIEYYALLKDVMEDLCERDFCRIHKAYIVNIKHVEEFNYKEMYALMDNGDHCQLSRKYAKELIKK